MVKAREFVTALVMYAMRCIEDGETDALARMGLGPSDLATLAGLTFGDLKRIEKLESHLDINIDLEAFGRIIRQIRADGLSAEWEHALIEADAPFEMMRRLFGTNRRDYAKLRQVFDVSKIDGERTNRWKMFATPRLTASDELASLIHELG